MIYTYDETTGGAKRIDWDLTDSDLTKDEEQALETLIRRFLSRRPFANDIEDIDFSLSINVTGKWHDEYPDYSGIGEEYDLSELKEESSIPVNFTENQLDNLYRFVNANRHRNGYLFEIVDVLKKASKS